MAHPNEPAGNAGVTLNGKPLTPEQIAALRAALGITGNGGNVTLAAGNTTTIDPGLSASVQQRGDANNVIFDFLIPAGKDGKNGTGSITAKATVSVPYGQPANVVDTGTPGVAELTFYIPEGKPGELPPGAIDGTILARMNGQYVWVPLPTGSGGSVSTISDSIMGKYPWETTTVPVTPHSLILDDATYAEYLAALVVAPVGSKRNAVANALQAALGTSQKLTMTRNGVLVLTATYTGAMTKVTVGSDIAVTFAGDPSDVTAIGTADSTTGAWQMVIAGGSNYSRTVTLPVATDVATAAGMGFNPLVYLVLPPSLDGL